MVLSSKDDLQWDLKWRQVYSTKVTQLQWMESTDLIPQWVVEENKVEVINRVLSFQHNPDIMLVHRNKTQCISLGF